MMRQLSDSLVRKYQLNCSQPWIGSIHCTHQHVLDEFERATRDRYYS